MVVFDGAGDTTLQSAILDGVFDKFELVMCAALSDFDGDGHFSVQVGLAVLGVFNATLDTRAEVTCVMLSKRLLVFFWLERLDREIVDFELRAVRDMFGLLWCLALSQAELVET